MPPLLKRLLFCSMEGNSDKFYTDWEESFESFDQMNLHENLLRGIYAYGAFHKVHRIVQHPCLQTRSKVQKQV